VSAGAADGAILSASPAASSAPGRVCPLRYRYGAAAIARAPLRQAQTLYVVGGLYGNVPALNAVEWMARSEAVAPTLCFNGDFNWFNVADHDFAEINLRVLANDAILGNVEAELDAPFADAGCGCAYPERVSAAVVERSNRIHHRLKLTAGRHADLCGRIALLPMVARYQVGECRVGVVHGDAESLAGWRFDPPALDDAQARPWLQSAFAAAAVDLFASSHTCLPAVRRYTLATGRLGGVVNNGAAGMPNFAGDLSGLCTRIATTPSPHAVLQEVRVAGAYVALLPVHYDAERWQADFVAQWPSGSDAWLSYFERITRGPAYLPAQAVDAAPSTPGKGEHDGHQGSGF